MANVLVEQMQDKLLTLDQVRERLETTEPLQTTHLSSENKIQFLFDQSWATSLDTLHGDENVAATIVVDGTEHQMSKDAALQAAAAFGIPGAYMKKVPTTLLEPQLNYWYNGGIGSREFKMVRTGADGHVSAFIKPTIVPFSNRLLLDNALLAITERYGSSGVLADYKFSHSLQQTDIRLIIPERDRTITNSGTENDLWSAGVHLSNSLVGSKQTSVDAYLFRWWCTNGATAQMPNVGTWSRRRDGQTDDVYDWARESVDEVLGGMESAFDRVQSLTRLELNNGKLNEVLSNIFVEYKVPKSQRGDIIEELIGADNLNMYTLQQAITRQANDPTISPDRADKLMRIGGDITTSVFNNIKAEVWREGHTADPDQPNPYEIVPTEV